ncbi:hypothetical protein [Novosphingobium pentaromativorans]|uniref:Uncharacterized protein n=1 Tax=Novosphingobium pentaromativorans US6-1 TaxID=1088721 RepID=G6EEH6_9SPHN|nr:hypothetical protein [Novosphingobium pentaromativorans]AIT79435.1 hypothetical protein JI59_06390 [Novosphingobium pentaromativorans US6-1]EHJ60400.1 hypothetical protein NSU_2748 [Novosphingobium pentaromativorans US6-1]
MRTLTKIVAPALVAVLGIATIAPASAHEAARYDNVRHDAARHTPARNASIRSDINDLRRDIDRAAARRTISQREAKGLRRDAAGIQRLYASYARNGLSAREMQILQRKVDRVHIALRMERHDRDNRRG